MFRSGYRGIYPVRVSGNGDTEVRDMIRNTVELLVLLTLAAVMIIAGMLERGRNGHN